MQPTDKVYEVFTTTALKPGNGTGLDESERSDALCSLMGGFERYRLMVSTS